MTDDITRKRWERAQTASDHTPEQSLLMALDAHRRGEINLKHAIVVYAMEPEPGHTRDGVGFFQSGAYSAVNTVGLLEYAKSALIEALLKSEK